MQENPAPFSLNFSSPMAYSFKERSSHIAPSPQPPSKKTEKNPLKMSVHFRVTITVCKQGFVTKFVICSPSPRDCGEVSHPQRHSYYGF